MRCFPARLSSALLAAADGLRQGVNVLLSEPPPTQGDLNFSVLGIPVRVHPMFWAISGLLGLSGTGGKLGPILIWVGVCFVSILIHELGHALTARAHGWQPHITLYGMGGLASYQPTYHSPRSQILITAAGPGAGFAFALVILATIAATGHVVDFDWQRGGLLPIEFEPFESDRINMLVYYLLFINIFWGLVNLLPVYPLDGGQISREVLGLVNPSDSLRQSLWLSVVTGIVVAILAWTKMHDIYITLFFGYLAYSSYTMLESYFGRGGGLGGRR